MGRPRVNLFQTLACSFLYRRADMRRREFIAAVGAAAAWPLTVRAQQAGVPVVGFLRSTPEANARSTVAALRKGLAEAGYVEGQNVAIEQRHAEDDRAQLPKLAAELVRQKVAAIVTHQFA